MLQCAVIPEVLVFRIPRVLFKIPPMKIKESAESYYTDVFKSSQNFLSGVSITIALYALPAQ